MRNIIFLVIGLATTLVAFAQPKISFETINHDFGKVSSDKSNLTHAFRYVNTGDSVLVVSNVQSHCDCTALNWDNPLQPGDTGVIYFTIKPVFEEEAFNEKIDIFSNASNGKVMLYLQGQSADWLKKSPFYRKKMGALMVESKYVSFGNVEKKGVLSKEVSLYNQSDETIIIDSLSVLSPTYLKIKFSSYQIKPHSEVRMGIVFTPKNCNRLGYGSDNLRFNTNEAPEHRLKEFFVVSTLFPDLEEKGANPRVIVSTNKLDMGVLSEGEVGSAQITISNVGDAPLKIVKLDPNCDCLRFSNLPSKIDAGSSVDLQIYFNSEGRLENQYKSFSIFTNDPLNPAVFIALKAHVNP